MAAKWTPEAEELANRAPIFIRAFAKKKIEKAAEEAGIEEITLKFVEDMRKKLMG